MKFFRRLFSRVRLPNVLTTEDAWATDRKAMDWYKTYQGKPGQLLEDLWDAQSEKEAKPLVGDLLR